jgi:hypothetical protein
LGVVIGRSADTLLVRWPEFSNEDAVPLADISQLEVSTGGQRNLLKGATVGMLAGGAIRALAGSAGTKSDSHVGKDAMAAEGGIRYCHTRHVEPDSLARRAGENAHLVVIWDQGATERGGLWS